MKSINNFSQFEMNNDLAVNVTGGNGVTRTRTRSYSGSLFGTQIETAVSDDESAVIETAEDSTASIITYSRAIPRRTRS